MNLAAQPDVLLDGVASFLRVPANEMRYVDLQRNEHNLEDACGVAAWPR